MENGFIPRVSVEPLRCDSLLESDPSSLQIQFMQATKDIYDITLTCSQLCAILVVLKMGF